jgi:5'-methylthioadenosine phosphorylase
MASGILGVIGGSGFYSMPGLEGGARLEINTPFGKPSDVFYKAAVEGTEIVFLSRHGSGHRLLPSEVNYRANIYGMKLLGVEYLLSVSAVGSLREDLAPGDFVLVDQFVDRTFLRPSTFFGNGIVAHVSLADPVCAQFAGRVAEAVKAAGSQARVGGTYICIEGPEFSTRAESEMYRSMKMDVIGMTAMQEARLAREAELCYAALATVTDYDCWHRDHRNVEIGDVLRVLRENVDIARTSVIKLAGALSSNTRSCACSYALKGAIITERRLIPQKVLEQLQPLIGKYLQAERG